MELFAFKLKMGVQQRFAHLSSSWLVNLATSDSQHLVEQEAKHMAQMDNHVEGIMWSILLGNP